MFDDEARRERHPAQIAGDDNDAKSEPVVAVRLIELDVSWREQQRTSADSAARVAWRR